MWAFGNRFTKDMDILANYYDGNVQVVFNYDKEREGKALLAID